MSERASLVARGLRTRRDICPAFRRSDLCKRLNALRRRYERAGEAFIERGGVDRAVKYYARALHVTRRAHRIAGVA